MEKKKTECQGNWIGMYIYTEYSNKIEQSWHP